MNVEVSVEDVVVEAAVVVVEGVVVDAKNLDGHQ
jgi:hypothetical protein